MSSTFDFTHKQDISKNTMVYSATFLLDNSDIQTLFNMNKEDKIFVNGRHYKLKRDQCLPVYLTEPTLVHLELIVDE